MSPYLIHSGPEIPETEIRLPWSKSIVNRLLLIHYLAGLPLTELEPYCDCSDSRELYKALLQQNQHINIGEGAAPFRFCLALMTALNKHLILDARGSMLHRDISPLVDALNAAGASIKYLGETGKPPVIIEHGLNGFKDLTVDTENSSQFASALMLVAPLFSGEKVIEITGNSVSTPYLKMSAALMFHYGVQVQIDFKKAQIHISEGTYNKQHVLPVEADWSAAAFFYTLVSIHPETSIRIKGLHRNSLQGDSILPELFTPLGVETRWNEEGLELLSCKPSIPLPPEMDFREFPDLLPAFLVACAVGKRRVRINGIAHLAMKESNRTETLFLNFRKLGVDFFHDKNCWVFNADKFHIPDGLTIETAKDHRMAMAFAMLAVLKPLRLDDADCVNKSFPCFWDELKKCNLKQENQRYGI